MRQRVREGEEEEEEVLRNIAESKLCGLRVSVRPCMCALKIAGIPNITIMSEDHGKICSLFYFVSKSQSFMLVD